MFHPCSLVSAFRRGISHSLEGELWQRACTRSVAAVQALMKQISSQYCQFLLNTGLENQLRLTLAFTHTFLLRTFHFNRILHFSCAFTNVCLATLKHLFVFLSIFIIFFLRIFYYYNFYIYLFVMRVIFSSEFALCQFVSKIKFFRISIL